MSDCDHREPKSLSEIAGLTGEYPVDAYEFVREGLEYSARTIHGPMTPAQFVVAQYMASEKIDLAEVLTRKACGSLDPVVTAAIDQCDAATELNRNVSGEDLCWALRDFALRRWGRLALLVLGRWNITRTDDFGHIVFTLVEQGVMQKEPHDSIDHFKSVYPFGEAFRKPIHVEDIGDA